MVKKEEKPKTSKVEEDKFWAAISYLWILFIFTILLKKDSEYAMYHAKQGLMLFICSLIVMVLSWIPVAGFAILVLGSIAIFILFVIGLYNAITGKKEPLPVIGKYGEGIKI
ncbi:MAG: hypothetical protein QW703_01895 [Candidatus Aenigmatarchaeota archaeon]